MADPVASSSLQLTSEIRKDGTLELSLQEVPVPEPGEDEVLVRIEAAPINPSDLGLLFGPADVTTIKQAGTADRPVVTAEIPEKLMGVVAPRLGHALPVGNEGAGVVVKAGASEAAQALVGKTVSAVGGGMYSQYRCIKAGLCLVLPEGTTPAEGASCFVNPLTALGMVETMRLEGYTALVHTAAASNLGQMLVKLCLQDGVELVNIVRKAEHVTLLKSLGAKHVCDSSQDSFRADLTAALVETGATLAFDATGGGRLASQILACMEVAASQTSKEFSRYGSTTHKQVYIYGGLDRTPTRLDRNFGMAWGIGGWLLTPFLQKIGLEHGNELRQRVAREIKTTFASHYTQEVSLAGALQLDAMAVYVQQATGEKYLINPAL
ncbi:MAG: zinc-binding dehydrogenase [Deltaproteobacteria bacterium]|nr:zinc-binding dehydrogenase [Deltaproteobacteria bacterium]